MPLSLFADPGEDERLEAAPEPK